MKSSKQEDKDRSWIWAIIVVSIFFGIRVCTNLIEKANERKMEEIINNCGGIDNFRKMLSGDDEPTYTPEIPQLKLTPELIEQLNK